MLSLLLTGEDLNSFLRTSAVAEVRKRDNPLTPTQNKKDRPSFEHPVDDRGRFERSYELPLSRKFRRIAVNIRHIMLILIGFSDLLAAILPAQAGQPPHSDTKQKRPSVFRIPVGDRGRFQRSYALPLSRKCRRIAVNIRHIMLILIGFPDLLAAILPA